MYCPEHAGDRGNEMIDRMADRAAANDSQSMVNEDIIKRHPFLAAGQKRHLF